MKIRNRKKLTHSRLIAWLEPHILEDKQLRLHEDYFKLHDLSKLYYNWRFIDIIPKQVTQQDNIRERILKFLPYNGTFKVPHYMEDILFTVTGTKSPKYPKQTDYVNWCKEHATGYWAVSDTPLLDSIVTVAFSRAEDMVMFKLTFA